MSTLFLHGTNGSYAFNPHDPLHTINTRAEFGAVWFGVDANSNRVIVKRLRPSLAASPESVERFLSEARLTPNIPGVAHVLDVATVPPEYFVIRAYVEGTDLKKYDIRKQFGRRNARKVVINIMLEACDILARVHACGIVHGDLKPANFVISANRDSLAPALTLIDFGQAYRPGSPPIYRFPGESRFALLYAPPEQVLSRFDLMGPASDIYSLAVTFYELLSRRPAWYHGNPVLLMNLQMNLPLPSHPSIRKPVLRVLQKAAAKVPFPKPPHLLPPEEVTGLLASGIAQRYPDVLSFREALAQAFDKT